MDLAATIPNYAAALEWERRTREEAFLGFADPICGVPVAPLSLRRFNLLLQVRSPFVCNGTANTGDVALFLWIVSEDFKVGDNRARDCFLGRIRSEVAIHDLPTAETEIGDYLAAALKDSPSSKRGGSSVPVTCFAASIVDAIASEYGWSLAEIMDTPLACLYGLLRRIALRHDRNAIFANRRSDKAVGDWQRSLISAGNAPASVNAEGRPSETPDPSTPELPG